MILKRIIFAVFSLFFFACNYPENDEILGTWNIANYDTLEKSDNWIPPSDHSSMFKGKCSQRPDYFKFEADGVFQSAIVGANCVDSIIQTGTWELDKKNLKILYYHNDFKISAKIKKLTSDRLTLEAEALNKYGTQWMIFWRKE